MSDMIPVEWLTVLYGGVIVLWLRREGRELFVMGRGNHRTNTCRKDYQSQV